MREAGSSPTSTTASPALRGSAAARARSFLAHPLRKSLAVYQHCRASSIMESPVQRSLPPLTSTAVPEISSG